MNPQKQYIDNYKARVLNFSRLLTAGKQQFLQLEQTIRTTGDT